MIIDFFIALSLLLIVILIIRGISKRYIKAPADKILVIYGKVSTTGKAAVWMHGGASFVWPVIQDYIFLDLSSIELMIDGKFLIKNDIEINLKVKFVVAISTEPGIADNAVERLLGLEPEMIKSLAMDIIYGQLRVYFVQIDVLTPITSREKMLLEVSQTIEDEINKIGLKLISMNILEISDIFGLTNYLDKKFHELVNLSKLKTNFEKDGDLNELQKELAEINDALKEIEHKRLSLNEKKLELFIKINDLSKIA